MTKIQKISRNVNEVLVEQRVKDGFINATAMCLAHGKLVADWFRNQETIDLLQALAKDLEIDINYGISHNSGITGISAIYPQLVVSRKGSPQTGGGTWLHPDLAIQIAQWCSPAFAIQVSRGVREWMTTGKNPMWAQQSDVDRVVYRDVLEDQARLRMTDQVKIYLERIRRYDDKKYSGQFFAKIHDQINKAITTETARTMRNRISLVTGIEIKEGELIRDYFPAMYLQRYISVCEAVANFMIRDNVHPSVAVERATEIVLPADYQATSIDFSENIKFVRQRLSQPTIGSGGSDFLLG